MVDQSRIHVLNGKDIMSGRKYVLYWMQASQRVGENPAFLHALEMANSLGKPLVVVFGLTARFPHAGRRHYLFMLEGLREVRDRLHDRGVRFLLGCDGPVGTVLPLLPDAALVIVDGAYGTLERSWREDVARSAECLCLEVEGNVVVPVATASVKEEYSAATLRRKIEPMISWFATPTEEADPAVVSSEMGPEGNEDALDDPQALMDTMGIDDTIPCVSWIHGGEGEAVRRLQDFIAHRLDGYADRHNDPVQPYVSNLSPYLHFGMISPSMIYREVAACDVPDVPVFLEELVVRRELAINFVRYNPMHDQYDGLPAWAIRSLEQHSTDTRQDLYPFDRLLNARTHDPYWNAAQLELTRLGTMHGYMRMYWGKKILEWSPTPRIAFEWALLLNNRYQLDGRDPNGYAGVAWCFGKHDRPWAERPIFGNIRYMNANGLRRKFDIDRYVDRINSLLTKENRLE